MYFRGTDPKNRFSYKEYLLGGCILAIALLVIIPICIHWENQITTKADALPPADSSGGEHFGT